MIQRIQTIYIVLGSIFHFFSHHLYALKNIEFDVFWVMIKISCIILALITVFSYNKRKRQIQYMYFLICVVFIVSLLNLHLYSNLNEFLVFILADWGWVCIIFSILTICFYCLAIIRIKKDDDLVESINRIR